MLIESLRPSFNRGFAHGPGESAYPSLWQSLYYAPNFPLGRLGARLVDFSHRRVADGIFSTFTDGVWTVENESGRHVMDCNGNGRIRLPAQFHQQQITYAFRVKFPDVTDHQQLLMDRTNWNDNFGMQVWINYNSGNHQLQGRNRGSTSFQSPTVLPVDVWYHLCICYDDTNLEFFIDGESDSSGTVLSYIVSNEEMDISGFGHSDSTYPYEGLMTDFFVWDRVLTPGEVKQLAGGASPFHLKSLFFPVEVAVSEMVRVANETVNLTESEIKRLRSIRLIGTTINLTEGYLRALSKMAGTTVQATDTAMKRLRSIRLASTTINITESILKTFIHTLNGTINVSIGQVKRLRAARVLSATINLADSALKRNRSIRFIPETVNLVEGVLKWIIKALSTTINITESADRIAGFVRLMASTVNITEGVLKTWIKVSASTVNLIAGKIKRLRAIKRIAEALNITESILKTGIRILSSSISISVAANRAVSRAMSETVQIAVGAVKRFRAVRFINGTENMVSGAVKRLRTVKQIATSTNLTEAGRKVFALVKRFSETTSIIAGAIRKLTIGEAILTILLKGRHVGSVLLKGAQELILTLKGKFN